MGKVCIVRTVLAYWRLFRQGEPGKSCDSHVCHHAWRLCTTLLKIPGAGIHISCMSGYPGNHIWYSGA